MSFFRWLTTLALLGLAGCDVLLGLEEKDLISTPPPQPAGAGRDRFGADGGTAEGEVDGKVDIDAGPAAPAAACDPQAELCNGKDDDCDDRVDEGADQACYTASLGCEPEASAFRCLGVCKAGRRVCSRGNLGEACEGEVVPADEACDSRGVSADEDCDGELDEGCECTPEQTAECYSAPASTRGVGICQVGHQICSAAGRPGACMDEVLPVAESCANQGMDDDCDGEPDDIESLGDPCTDDSQAGECRHGVYACSGATLVCRSNRSQSERCNGSDDDCDGTTDEDFHLDSDRNNCGSCGHACSGSEVCCDGNCAAEGCQGACNDTDDRCSDACPSCARGRICRSDSCVECDNTDSYCSTACPECPTGTRCTGDRCVAATAGAGGSDSGGSGGRGGGSGVCGGFAGSLCGADEFCDFPEGRCGGGIGMCRVQPANCTRIYMPVCGCDGQTYGNSCSAAGSGVSVRSQGECPAP